MNQPANEQKIPQPCKALRADGQPCQGRSFNGSGFCFIHDPAHREAVRKGRSKGAKKSLNRLRVKDLTSIDLSTPAGIEEALEKLAHALAQGRIGGTEARTLVTVLSKLCEVRDLRRIEDELDEEKI